jgi:hypothetical protein
MQFQVSFSTKIKVFDIELSPKFNITIDDPVNFLSNALHKYILGPLTGEVACQQDMAQVAELQVTLVKNPPIIPTFKVGILAGHVTIPT